MRLGISHISRKALENFIPFEKCKRCTKRKYFVVWVVSHFIYNIVMRKRVKLNSYEPLVRDKSMKFVTRSWYNKIFPFVKPFEFLKRNKNFQWEKLEAFSGCDDTRPEGPWRRGWCCRHKSIASRRSVAGQATPLQRVLALATHCDGASDIHRTAL